MKRRICILVLATSTICSAAPDRVVVTGSSLDCLAGKVYHTPGVEVFVFPKSQQLTMLIDGVLKSTNETVLDRFDKLISFVKSGRALAHTRSDRNGFFRAEIPAKENLTVFGYLEAEDNPLYWMHADVIVNHRPAVSVVLDYCKRP